MAWGGETERKEKRLLQTKGAASITYRHLARRRSSAVGYKKAEHLLVQWCSGNQNNKGSSRVLAANRHSPVCSPSLPTNYTWIGRHCLHIANGVNMLVCTLPARYDCVDEFAAHVHASGWLLPLYCAGSCRVRVTFSVKYGAPSDPPGIKQRLENAAPTWYQPKTDQGFFNLNIAI